jgi:hypothetical protein
MLLSFDVTPFGNVTSKLLLRRQADKVTPSVVLTTITPVVPATITSSAGQRCLSLDVICEAGIALLLCRVWLFLLASSELALLGLVCSPLDVSVK